MRIIIIGGGEIGYALCSAFSAEHDVFVVDNDPEVAGRFTQVDSEFIEGSGTNSSVLRHAQAAGCDLLIACTGLDEVNIVACSIGSQLGALDTVCFVSKHDFVQPAGGTDSLRDHFGIKRVIWPEARLAAAIERIIMAPGAIDAGEFADGRVRLLEFRLDADSPLVGKTVSTAGLPYGVVAVAVRKSDALLIPRGGTPLEAGDKVALMGTNDAMEELRPRLSPAAPTSTQLVTIIGGGDVGYRLAQRLDAAPHVDLRVIESDRARGELLAAALSHSLVLHGDGTDLELLEAEEIGRSDVMVSVIDNDERNLLASLLGRQLGVRKVITRVGSRSNLRLFELVGIDVALSARGAAVASVVHQVDGGRSSLLAVLEQGEAKVIELMVPTGHPGSTLQALNTPADSIVAVILRGDDAIVPRGTDVVLPGDRLLVCCTDAAARLVRDILNPVSSCPSTPFDRTFMRLSHVVQVAGRILRLFGLMFLAPVAVAIFYGETGDIAGFVIGGALAGSVGHLLVRAGHGALEDLRQIEALAVVSGTWLVVAHLGAVPYVWAGLSPVDALFESMSGFTTTGATILVDFDRLGRAMMFWRSLSQWLGGMGVITLFVAVLPRLAIDMRQLFFAEAPGPTDQKLTPHLRQTAAYLWRLYSGLTLAQAIALIAAGMPIYDAICHAMTTLAAGGFSPNPESIMGYNSATVEWIICFFMFLAGANFALQYRVLLGRPGVVLRDDEFRAYTGIVVAAAACLTVLLWTTGDQEASVRAATFQTLSILTTTGYASVDFELWTDQAKVVLLALMFIGGCAGSAAGGPKVLRHVLVGRYTLLELRRTLHPRGVLPVKLDGRVVPDEIMRRVLVFFLFYILMFALCAAVVIGLGADTVTGFTATIATLGNIGPGMSSVGPMASYAHLHGVSKIVLTLAMWIGRLEVLTVLALLRPEVWRAAHWKGLHPSHTGQALG